MNRQFLQARITATQAQIAAYEQALLDLASGAIQEYRLDTGQDVQQVTKLSLSALQNVIDSLYNRCAMLEARLNGGNSVVMGPSW